MAYIIQHNGLAIKRLQSGAKKNYWRIYHINTGHLISGKIGWSMDGGRWKLREVKNALYSISSQFPWNEWTIQDDPPGWADDAFNAISQIERLN